MRDRCRRSYLRALAAGAAGGLAGCSGLPGPLAGDPRTGTYLDWLPAPESLEREPYGVHLVEPGGADDHWEQLHPATRRAASYRWVPFNPDVREAVGQPTRMVEPFEGVVLMLGVEADDPVSKLADIGYDRETTRGEFDLLSWDRLESDLEFAPRVAAVRADDVVLGATDGERPEVTAVVDAYRGEVQRYHAAAPRVETVGTAVGERTFTTVTGAPDRAPRDWLVADPARRELPGLVALARGWELDGDVARLRLALEFEDDDDAEVADVHGTMGGRWLAECRESSLTRQGATVELSATIGLDRFDFRYAGDPGEDGIPDAGFDLERDLDEMVATHAGGQSVPADALAVALYTNVRLPETPVERQVTERQFAEEYDVVEPGDSMAFAPPTDGQLRVEWVHPGSGGRLALGGLWYDA